jgi:hypothetical protein
MAASISPVERWLRVTRMPDSRSKPRAMGVHHSMVAEQ